MPLIKEKLESNVKFVAISDVHEHDEIFFDLVSKFTFSSTFRLLFCGDANDKGAGDPAFYKIVEFIKPLVDSGLAWYIKGNHELKKIKKAKKDENQFNNLLQWIDKQPTAVYLSYDNGQSYLAVHAGINPKMTWDKLNYDLEVAYTRLVDSNGHNISIKLENDVWVPTKPGGVSWHDVYDGRFGYVIAGHQPHHDGPKFYNYSCNLDCGVFNTGKQVGIIFGSEGKEDIVESYGKPLLCNNKYDIKL